MNINDKKNIRGSTRILFGLIITLGVIAEALFSKNEYSVFDYSTIFGILMIGLILIHSGYIAGKNSVDI